MLELAAGSFEQAYWIENGPMVIDDIVVSPEVEDGSVIAILISRVRADVGKGQTHSYAEASSTRYVELKGGLCFQPHSFHSSMNIHYLTDRRSRHVQYALQARCQVANETSVSWKRAISLRLKIASREYSRKMRSRMQPSSTCIRTLKFTM